MFDLERQLEIQLQMEKDIRADSYGDIYGHESYAEEIFLLRQRLIVAQNLISEMHDYLSDGGYLGQDAGILYSCKDFLGKIENNS